MENSEIDFSQQDPEVLLNLVLTKLEQGDFQQRWEISKILPDLGIIALEPLLNILQDETADVEMRWFVARILGNFKSELIIEPLINLLKNAKIEATEAEISLQEITTFTLAGFGISAIAPLTQLLEKADSKLLATQALAQIRHSEIITPLLTVVNDPNPRIRAIAIEALGSFHDPRVIPILLVGFN
jgi:HEAT repeat.